MCAIVTPMRAACEAPGPVLAALFGLVLACTNPPGGTSPAPPPASPSPAVTRTANNDVRGVGSQPDYEGEAGILRARLADRLPNPPPERAAACKQMLDAAVEFYTAVEREEASRTRVLADLQATRTEDLARCEQETSARAAACAAIRLSERDAEFPWVLDQCVRAFPE
jgi:hypothetical protein